MIIRSYNNIASQGINLLQQAGLSVKENAHQPQAIILRSHKLASTDIPNSVCAVARAGAGTNNIPTQWLSERGIPVFNTPGANANAVKELVIAAMLIGLRHLAPAMQFVNTLQDSAQESLHQQVETGKKQFKGHELPQRTLGVIGLGAIGAKVAHAALQLNMRVVGYDPAISVKQAWQLASEIEEASSLESLLRCCDIVTLHVPYLDSTHHLINAQRLALLPPHSLLLNFARADIVDSQAVTQALNSQQLAAYLCDFPDPLLQNHSQVVALPHLGASTQQAEENCALMAAQQLQHFLQLGHINNSVNFPNVKLGNIPPQAQRLAIANANVPNMVAQISSALAADQLNIIDLVNKSHHDLAYTLIDTDQPIPQHTIAALQQLPGILSLRTLPA